MELTNELINLLNGCGGGVILLIGLYYFIKYIGEQARLNSEERITTHQKFCETITELTERFYSHLDGNDKDNI